MPSGNVHASQGHAVQPGAGSGRAQLPSAQTSPTSQVVVQPPQRSGSRESGHAPSAHASMKKGQAAVHWPLAQTWPGAQAVPHAPQCCGSSGSRRHSAPQRVRPGAQVQVDWLQISPRPQAVPQAPQWRGSTRVSVQVPEQSVAPAGQAQAPFRQTWEAPQESQLAPQWRGSVATSQQRPSPQASCGLRVQVVTQAPAWHDWEAGHAWPQSPQLAGSLSTSRHSVPQIFSPGGQVQAPARQEEPEMEQKARQVPQLMEDCWRSTQRAPLQRSPRPAQEHSPLTHSVPGGQKVQELIVVPGTQAPATQDSVEAQARSQAPQWCESESRSAQSPAQSVSGAGQAAPGTQVWLASSQRYAPGQRPSKSQGKPSMPVGAQAESSTASGSHGRCTGRAPREGSSGSLAGSRGAGNGNDSSAGVGASARSLVGMKLVPGLYESPVTNGLRDALDRLGAADTTLERLTDSSAPHVLARLLYDATVRAMRALPSEERLAGQVALANRVLEVLGEGSTESGIGSEEAVADPAELLLAVIDREQAKLGTGTLLRPSLPLRHSDLLVNGPRDLRVGNEVRRELASADRVDLLVSFVKWSGLRLLRAELRDFVARRPGGLRVLTTTYMGASDAEAIEALLELGAQVKVSYDTRRTRLHAKAWLFHRDSGFTTGLVGSSNLSAAAMLDGCEWNVRLSTVDNAPILTKFLTTFEQYWEDGEFEAYDRERFRELTTRRDADRDALARAVQLRPFSHQQAALDALEAERAQGHHRNLLVAATGTGKTVIAALDYARQCRPGHQPSLLFVAHRQEILKQSLATFRAAMRDGHFGELMVGDERPTIGRQVFASVQALHGERLKTLASDAYEVVIVDEFHHAEADTYRRLLSHLRPRLLVGLTATPERADGKSVLEWFDHRVAFELRLWDAIDQGLVVPFQYFGIHDGIDLTKVDFKAGRYDVATLEHLYTADTARALAVLRELERQVPRLDTLRALGFCVSVKHAEFMAKYFSDRGVASVAVSGESSRAERDSALRRLRQGEVRVVFSRDLFNEGLDVPSVNTVLFLRPTESATVFLQQLGRGLRHEDGKACLTVLDFVGNARREFRFDERFRALTGVSTRRDVERAVLEGFPHLPAGCEIRLDRESQRAVLENVRAHLGTQTEELRSDLRRLGDVALPEFLEKCGLTPEEFYRDGDARRVLTNLKRELKLRPGDQLELEPARALARVLHVDDPERLGRWSDWLREEAPPEAMVGDPHALMLFAVLGYVRSSVDQLLPHFRELWKERDLVQELGALFGILADRIRRPTHALPGLPFRVHATYTRDEISAGLGEVRKGKLMRTQGGVFEATAARADVLFVTLDKDPKHFTPTTLYRDYPISPTRFHWESQSITRADSRTGRRYQDAGKDPSWRTLLFVRKARESATGTTSPYLFLGPARYVSHESEKPMQIIWELERAMPPAFFAEAKVAAG